MSNNMFNNVDYELFFCYGSVMVWENRYSPIHILTAQFSLLLRYNLLELLHL